MTLQAVCVASSSVSLPYPRDSAKKAVHCTCSRYKRAYAHRQGAPETQTSSPGRHARSRHHRPGHQPGLETGQTPWIHLPPGRGQGGFSTEGLRGEPQGENEGVKIRVAWATIGCQGSLHGRTIESSLSQLWGDFNCLRKNGLRLLGRRNDAIFEEIRPDAQCDLFSRRDRSAMHP